MKALRLKPELTDVLSNARTELKTGSGTEFGLSTGIPEIDRLIGGIPRGEIALAAGPLSSGRATLILSTIARTISQSLPCALIDVYDSFDVISAEAACFDLDRLLWVRCGSNIQHAVRATEIVLQSGAFGLVILDMALCSKRDQKSLPSPCWLRFRRIIEKTSTSLLIVAPENFSISAAKVSIDLGRGKAKWASGEPVQRATSDPLVEIEFNASRHKPFPPVESQGIHAFLPHSIAE